MQSGRSVDLDETLVDEGRTRWMPPSVGSSLAETVLDEGRGRPFPPSVGVGVADLAETLLDEGRERPRVVWPQDGLPAALNGRYEWLERLGTGGSQGDMHLVRVRATGERAVIKQRHVPRPPEPALVDYLTQPHDRIVRYLEIAAGYEVMGYLSGETLGESRRATPGGFTFDELHAVTQQVAAALTDLHRHKFVHRDVKPANIMLSPGRPISTTLVDFGIAGPIDSTDWPDQLNPAYQPPEWSLLGEVSPPTDWWGLGMTILELAAGEHPFDGLDRADINRNFAYGRAVDVSGVPHERLRRLCQGLLVLDPARRWGWRQVGQWLSGGDDPELPDAQGDRHGDRPGGAAAPYEFLGVQYEFRDELAQAMTTVWNPAVRALFEQPEPLERLRVWLDQFTDDFGVDACRVVDHVRQADRQSRHVRLLHLVQALDPTRPPVYRNHHISRQTLLSIAHNAVQNVADNASVLQDLWEHRLLPLLDGAVTGDTGTGGDALTELERSWRLENHRWPVLVREVSDNGARQHLLAEVGQPEVLAVCLRAALHRQEDRDAADLRLREARAEMPVPVPWFDALTQRSEMRWVAFLLCGYAAGQARTEADRRRAENDAAEALRISAGFREWSRRQNRPAALGWAVAGICIFAAWWVALITFSDAAGSLGDAAIGLTWVGAAVSLVVSLVAECLLAAQIGGRFHRRYSIPGATAIALRPLGQWMQRSSGPAILAILAVLAGVGLMALLVPLALVAGTTVAHLIWAARRWSAWQAQVAQEEAQIAEAERRRDEEEPVDVHE
jgi:hypothetical protein